MHVCHNYHILPSSKFDQNRRNITGTTKHSNQKIEIKIQNNFQPMKKAESE